MEGLVNCEKRSSFHHVYNSEWLLRQTWLNLPRKKTLWILIKKEKLISVNFYFSFKLMSFLRKIFVTVHNKYSKIPTSASMHFANLVWRSRVVRLIWSSRLFTQAAGSKVRASNSSGVSTFLLYEGWNFNSDNYLFTTDTK